MDTLLDFVNAHPFFTVLYVVFIAAIIAFCFAARATLRRNVQERLARRARHAGFGCCAQCRDEPPEVTR